MLPWVLGSSTFSPGSSLSRGSELGSVCSGGPSLASCANLLKVRIKDVLSPSYASSNWSRFVFFFFIKKKSKMSVI